MFKHILLPTDGSEISAKAVKSGVKLAKALGAKVTGFFAVPDMHLLPYGELVGELMPPADYEKMAKEQAKKYLGVVEQAAKAANVPCETFHVVHDSPYQAIIKAAEDKGCDLIFIASHGRRGIAGILLGSETHKVLTHSKIPVLVYR